MSKTNAQIEADVKQALKLLEDTGCVVCGEEYLSNLQQLTSTLTRKIGYANRILYTLKNINPYIDTAGGLICCVCEAETKYGEDHQHKVDCPWVNAKQYFEQKG